MKLFQQNKIDRPKKVKLFPLKIVQSKTEVTTSSKHAIIQWLINLLPHEQPKPSRKYYFWQPRPEPQRKSWGRKSRPRK